MKSRLDRDCTCSVKGVTPKDVTPDVDPIGTLIAALENDGKPTLAWMVRWSNHSGEPLQAAWEASEDPWAMVQLLMRTGRDWPLGRYSLVNSGGLRKRAAARADGAVEDDRTQQYVVLGEGRTTSFLRRDADGARTIREIIPFPPTLETVLRLGPRFTTAR